MAKLKVTIDIFSGRPNPVVELSAADSREALKLLSNARRLEAGEPGLPPVPTLGYRGLIVEQEGELARGLPRAFRLSHGQVFGTRAPLALADESLEDLVLSGPRLRGLELGRDFAPMLQREIERFRELRRRYPWDPPKPRPVKHSCRCAPLYEPAWWNDGGQKQHGNNCYNYGSNYRSDSFAQPGRAAGAMYTSLTGPAVLAGAVADGLIKSPKANNRCPGEGHLVALVIAPNIDFHWYRKGRSGRWSHKPGGTPVIDVDNSNALIADPRTADRGMYTQFTSFLVVMHGHIKIN